MAPPRIKLLRGFFSKASRWLKVLIKKSWVFLAGQWVREEQILTKASWLDCVSLEKSLGLFSTNS
jgi:hypothetical protein